MQRQRGGLVPIDDALSSMGGPVKAIQALRRNGRSFTLADQVNRLVSASEAPADLGFMGRTMALCSLPRSNPGNRHQYKRVNGPYKLVMTAIGDHKLPFGTNPRADPRLGVHGSGTHPKPRYRSRPVPLRVHEEARHL